jgi:ketosteroid isomerase-like protein
MADLTALESRLKRIEDRDEIRTLVARYGTIVDNRDMEALRGLFTPDATFSGKGAPGKIEGRDAVVTHYENRFNMMTVSNHFTHDHVIWFDDDEDGDGVARGHVNAHVEMIFNGDPNIVAMRYEDTYEQHESRWKFKERITSFFYYLKAEDYTSLLGNRQRVFTVDEPMDSDWPEGIATWQAYSKG